MFLKYLILFTAVSYYYISNNKNVCKTFVDYYYPHLSESCYYDADATLETPEIIKKYAETVEIHHVTTEDGYIVTLFRIPRPNPKGVILIHHSIATFSRIYLWQGHDSLAITLWNNGYDVWLANQRGTFYSDKHVNMTSRDFRYWDFSFHEMALYDIPAEIRLIRAMTNDSKIIFMGHSLGATTGLVYSTLKPQEAKNYIKVMILLAPACYLNDVDSVVNILQNKAPILKTSTDFFQMGSPFLRFSSLIKVSRISLRLFPFFLLITSKSIFALCGYTPEETDPSFFNYDAMMYLDNFSWKTVIHFIQIGSTNQRFQMFDYGEKENLRIYGDKIPSVFPLQNISLPILMVSSFNDSLITLKNSESLYEKLPQESKVYGHWKISGLNHLDYLIGKHRKEIFGDRLLSFLNTI